MKKIILVIVFLLVAFIPVVSGLEVRYGVVNGFRVCVFNGTQQNARSLAAGAVGMVNKSYSNLATKMIYDAPVFKVLVGACMNRIEATMLLAKLRPLFPNAFIVNDKVKLSEFVGVPSMEVQTNETEDGLEVDAKEAVK